MKMRNPSVAVELRNWLTQFLCLWMVIQGPPLEAAQQRIHAKSLVVGAAAAAPVEEKGWSAGVGTYFGQAVAAVRQATTWASLGSPEPAAGSSAAPSSPALPAERPLADLPPGQTIPPPPAPPGADVQALTGNATAPSPAAEKASVAVAPSFNLLSVSWQPANPAPAAVFAPIGAAVKKVYAYDACDPVDKWKVYDPASPGGSDLAAITPAKGFWLESAGSAGVTLPEAGPVPASVAIPLCVGWNLIGFPKSSPRPVAEALQSIAGKYIRLFGFDPADAVDPWEIYDVAVPAWANDMAVLQPGRGYWIYVTEAATLTFSNEDDLPSVEILSPADLAEVVGPTSLVGTVRSPDLASWHVAYREVDATAWIQLATGGTTQEAQSLATFDPTLLENGLYDVRLQAVDRQGNLVEDTITVVVAGQRKIGQFSLAFVDLEIEMAGIPIQVIRSYDSRRKDKKGDFGYGWTLDIRQGAYRTNGPLGRNWEIEEGPEVAEGQVIYLPCKVSQELRGHTATVRLSDQELYRFAPRIYDLAPTPGGCFAKMGFDFVDGPVPGAKLETLASNAVFFGNGSDQLVGVDDLELFDPRGVRLSTRDGRVFEVDRIDGIRKIRDSNENQLTITAGAIAHSGGLAVTLVRDGQGRIEKIVDTVGEDLRYTYDPNGDLTAFTDRTDAVTSFTYAGHYLETIVDPLGRTPIRNYYGSDGRLEKHVDAYGHEIVYEHRLAQNQERITNRLGKSRLLEYDARGNVIREVNEEQEETLRTFDGDDNLLTETDPLGHTTRNTYQNGNLISTTDPLGNVTRFTYNSRGDMLTITDPRGHVSTNAYDSKGNLTRSTDAQGQVTTYTYDRFGNQLTETDPLGHTVTRVYDGYGHLEKETDPNGHATSYISNLLGSRTRETTTRKRADGSIETLVTHHFYDLEQRHLRTTAPDGSMTRTEYDARGQVSATVDALGRRTTFVYDDFGRQTKTTYPDGLFEERIYDQENRLEQSKDRAGRITSFTYDDAGRLLKTTYPDATSTENTYDAAGRLEVVIDAKGKSTSFEHDAAGRRKKTIDALGFVTEFGYDTAGNQTSVKDAAGNVTAFVYDSLGRQVRVVYPDGTDTRTTYDVLGRRIAETDQAGKITRFGYDRLGRLESVTDALNQVTSYGYDDLGNRISQKDANGNVTTFEYDAAGRQTKRTLPGGALERFTYDAGGNLKSRTDFNGVTTLYDYDDLNRLAKRSYPGGEQVTFTYTATGRRRTAVDTRGTTTYDYDDRDRLEALTYPDGRQLGYRYDDNGNRRELKATVGPAALTTAYTHDDLNRLETVTDPEGGVTVHGYDPNGNRASLVHPNGVVTTYTYDPLNRLKNLTAVSAAGAPITSFSYTLGATGNRTKIVELDGTTKNYVYDDLYRLTSEVVTLGTAPRWSNSFTYDPVGNRKVQNRVEIGGATRNVGYTYDSRDRLQTEDSVHYGWDPNGNLISKSGPDGATYEWDIENRLKKVTLAGGTTVEHTYDVDGTRVRTVTTPPGGPAQSVDYLVDTSGALSHVVVEGTSERPVAAYYVRGDDLLSVIRPVEGEPAVVRNYHADGLGSIRALTDAGGEITDTWQFEAFGGTLEHSGPDPNAYLFAGEPLDPNVGWYYNRARWMDPQAGRFSTKDPFEGIGQDPASLHRYTYGHCDPANRIDPTGKFTTIQGAVAVMGVLGALTAIARVGVSGPSGTFRTIQVWLKPVIVNQTWDHAIVQWHLMEAREFYRQFGIAINWGPIIGFDHAMRDGEAYSSRSLNALSRELGEHFGEHAFAAFVGPLEVNGSPYMGLTYHIDSQTGTYISLISDRAVDLPIWTLHEFAHLIGGLEDQRFPFWGNLLARPFSSRDLEQSQIDQLRNHTRHLP